MTGGTERHVGADHHLIPNENLSVIHQHQIEIGVETLANVDMIAIGHMHRRFEEEVLAAAAQNTFHDGLTVCILFGMGIVILEHHFLAVIPLLLELFFLPDVDRVGMTMLVEQHAAVDSVT